MARGFFNVCRFQARVSSVPTGKANVGLYDDSLDNGRPLKAHRDDMDQ